VLLDSSDFIGSKLLKSQSILSVCSMRSSWSPCGLRYSVTGSGLVGESACSRSPLPSFFLISIGMDSVVLRVDSAWIRSIL